MSLLRLGSSFKPSYAAVRPAIGGAVVVLRPYSSAVHGNDPDKIAKEKARNLGGHQDSSAPFKEGAPGWNEHLASDAEANIKADLHGPSGKPGKELQAATVAHTHKHHHTEHGDKGAKSHVAKHNRSLTDSEDAVKADRGEH